TSTAGQRAATPAGLQADRQNALYDEPEEEEEVVAALAPAPTQPVASAALSAAGTASDTGLSAAGAANQTQLAASGRPLSGQQTAITGSGQAATTARSLVSQPPAQSAQTAAATSTATQTAAFGQSGQAAQAIAGQAVGAIEVNTGQGSVLQQTMQQALAMSASATTGIVTTGTTGAGGSGLPVSAIPGQSLGPSVGQGRGQTGLGFAGGTQLATLYFSHDSAGLSGQDLQVIGQLVNLLERSPGLVRVVGHASSRTRQLPLDGHLLANFQMSVARADAVAAELVRRGIDPARIIRQAMGDSAPVYSEAMPSGEAGNRRVEIWLDG
ncbi:MAG: OmpA family protein, partial [Alphaproteobacteria bacterium]